MHNNIMQVVILAAGFGTRMRPLTYHIPKPMIRIAGKNLLEHNIDNLPLDTISEIIIVVGYLKEQIINHFGSIYKGIPIKYVEQKKPLGTGHAISICAPYIRGEEFVVFMGDDLYDKKDLNLFVKEKGAKIAIKKIKSKFAGGKIVFTKEGLLQDIKEGVHEKGGFVNCALYKLKKDFLNIPPVPIKNGEEFGLPQTLIEYVKRENEIEVVEIEQWRQHSDLQDLLSTEKQILKEQGKDFVSALKNYFN